MRVLQLIDSLEAGGAERMAVNYANALSSKIDFSGLVSTRAEGSLLNSVDKKVSYLFLNKKSKIDVAAIRELFGYCKINKVEIIHAHSTSIFFAVIIKFLIPSIKIVWHDHYGNSEFLEERNSKGLSFLLKFCAGVIAVNSQLQHFIKNRLNFSNTIYLPNFASIDLNEISRTKLYGVSGKRIVCLANLREQKNHLLLLNVALKLKNELPDWTFHFVGKDFNDTTSVNIKKFILENGLSSNVFLYGSCLDTSAIVSQCDIAVLSSDSEGLPLAVLEYGFLKKPVVVTRVGELSNIINNKINGFIVKPNDAKEFYESLQSIIMNNKLRSTLGLELYKTIISNYSEDGVLEKYLKWVKKC